MATVLEEHGEQWKIRFMRDLQFFVCFFLLLWPLGTMATVGGEQTQARSGPPDVAEYKVFFDGKEVGNERLERSQLRTGQVPGRRFVKATSNVTLFGTVYRLAEEMEFDGRDELVRFSLAGDMGARKVSQYVRVENGQAVMDFDGEKRGKPFVLTSFVASDDTLASMNALLFERMMKSAGWHFIVPLMPEGRARVARRGEDVFKVDGREIRATRFFETGMTTKGSFAWIRTSGEMLATTGADARAFVVLSGYESILAQIPGIVKHDLHGTEEEMPGRTEKQP